MQYLIDNKIWPATPWFWKQKGLVILNSKEKYVHNHEILLEMQCLCFLNGHFTHKQKQKHTHTHLYELIPELTADNDVEVGLDPGHNQGLEDGLQNKQCIKYSKPQNF